MESYRASSVLGNLQTLGRRAARQLPKDPPLYSLHQNSNRLIGHRPPGPSILPHRLGAESRRTGGPSRPPTRNPAQVELLSHSIREVIFASVLSSDVRGERMAERLFERVTACVRTAARSAGASARVDLVNW